MANFLKNLFMGTPARTEQTPLTTPEQKSVLDKLLSQGAESFADFGPIEQQARTQFAEETIPGLAERFTSMGGGQRSSAFQSALGRAGAGLESSLAGLKSQRGAQQLGLGLQPQFQPTRLQREPGLLEQILPGLMQALGGYATGGVSTLLSQFGNSQPGQVQPGQQGQANLANLLQFLPFL